MEIKTSLGTITATVNNDPYYPGIYLSLKRDGRTFPIVWLEADQVDEKNPELKAHVYAPEEIWDEPVFSMTSQKETVDAMFEEAADEYAKDHP